MEYGDIVIVTHPQHPFYNCVGKVVGRRGVMKPNDVLMLLLIKNRAYIIPESMLMIYDEGRIKN